MTRSWLGYAILGAGLLATGAGVALLTRKTGSGLGRSSFGRKRPIGSEFRGRAQLPEATEVIKKNGMTVTHYKAKNMSIESRVGLIQKMVEESTKDPEMRKLALKITRKCPERDGECEAKAIYDWMKCANGAKDGVDCRWIRYTGDIAPIVHSDGSVEGVDYFSSPQRVIELGGEDCDGHSSLAASLLTLNGIPAKLRVTASDTQGDWEHIYAMAGLPKTSPRSWTAVDTTLPGDQRFGKEAPHAKFKDFIA